MIKSLIDSPIVISLMILSNFFRDNLGVKILFSQDIPQGIDRNFLEICGNIKKLRKAPSNYNEV